MTFELDTLKFKVPRMLRVKIFADGANKESIFSRYSDPNIAGFTTNPTLMRKSGVADYEEFAKDVLSVVKEKPISFEVFSDDWSEMESQARVIASWGPNVFVKVPITNTKGEFSQSVIEKLVQSGVKLNVTAMTTFDQVKRVAPLLARGSGGIVSVFAGRIADSGKDPLPIMKQCVDFLKHCQGVELLWASPREIYNLVQAEEVGCHIITITEDLLKKLSLLGGDLSQVSLDTVKMFHDDASAAGYQIRLPVKSAP
jgi:transaldolase